MSVLRVTNHPEGFGFPGIFIYVRKTKFGDFFSYNFISSIWISHQLKFCFAYAIISLSEKGGNSMRKKRWIVLFAHMYVVRYILNRCLAFVFHNHSLNLVPLLRYIHDWLPDNGSNGFDWII